MNGLLSALELLAPLAGVLAFGVGMHRWASSGDRGERLVPWLDRDEEFWCDDEEDVA